MAGNADPIRERASKEATDWLILLQEEPDDGDLRRRFRDWLDRSPANAAAWEATRQTVAALDAGRPAHADRWQPFLARLRGETDRQAEGRRRPSRRVSGARPAALSRRIGRRQALGLGGLAVAACLLAVAVAPRIALRLEADHATGTAETRMLRLADGSLVTLAPESAIRVAEGGDERGVELLSGRAFFEVAPNAERPFRVASEAIDVTVLGTGFEVRRGREATDVAVVHGAVRVDYAGVSPPVAETLEPGQTARVDWAGGVARGRLPTGQIAAWRHNQLIAQDQPLAAVVDRLRPYYGGRIVVTDDTLAGRPVTGVYDLAEPLTALRGIARAQNAVVRQVTPWILLVSPS